jgi:membrane-bound metal-dependent hydrolase YbcI (DUF457 family)
MFIGHIAVGLASKKLAPNVSLGILLGAPLLLDLIWPIFLLLGIETVRVEPGATEMTPLDLHDYPYTHSLAAALAWSLFAGGVHHTLTAERPSGKKDGRSAVVIAASVFSHWILDFVTHRPDMPLYPGSTKYVGLGLWHSRIGTIAVEVPMFFAAVYLYARITKANDKTGRYAYAALVAFLVVVYFANAYGPPPPSATAIALSALLLWLFVPWGGWIDRHRSIS